MAYGSCSREGSGCPGAPEQLRNFFDIAVWLTAGADGNISPEWDEWMGETPMLVMVAFVRNLAIGEVHSGPSGHEPVEGLI